MFSKFVNFVPIDLKLVHTMIGPILCTLQKNELIKITKYPIIKHRAFFKTLTFFISANNEDIVQ